MLPLVPNWKTSWHFCVHVFFTQSRVWCPFTSADCGAHPAILSFWHWLFYASGEIFPSYVLNCKIWDISRVYVTYSNFLHFDLNAELVRGWLATHFEFVHDSLKPIMHQLEVVRVLLMSVHVSFTLFHAILKTQDSKISFKKENSWRQLDNHFFSPVSREMPDSEMPPTYLHNFAQMFVLFLQCF